MYYNLGHSFLNGLKSALYKVMKLLKLEKRIDAYFNFLNTTSENYYAYKTYTFADGRTTATKCNKLNHASHTKEFADTTIVIQGPIIIKNSFTLRVVSRYLEEFPEANIVLSTWANRTPESFRKLEVQYSGSNRFLIIENQIPDNPGIANINLQLVSTQAGIEAVSFNPTKYLVKTRTDQCFFNAESLRILQDLHKSYPNMKGEGRIVAPSRGSFLLRPYGVTDMFTFGDFNTVRAYWSASLDKRSISELLRNETVTQEALNEYAEIYICKHYLRQKGYELDNTILQSLQLYRDEFIFFDSDAIDLIWRKYTANFHKYKHWDTNLKYKEVSHYVWRDLQENLDQYSFLQEYAHNTGRF